MRKKILLVIDCFGSGGAQTQMAMLCRGLVDVGYNVTVFTYHPNDYLRTAIYLKGIEIIAHKKKSSADIICQLYRLLSRGEYYGVISFLSGPNVYALAARTLALFRGNVIVGERNTFLGGKLRFRDYVERISYIFANSVVSNTNAQTKALSGIFPLFSRKLHTINNAVDTEYFTPHVDSDAVVSRSVVAVGRIVPDKNIVGLIKALRMLHDQGREDLVVCWVGKVHDEKYRKECLVLLEELQLSHAWSWVGEIADVRPYYRAAWLLVLPSFREGMPNVVGEAFSSGLPCAISDVAEARWLMDHQKNGSLFDPSSTKAIADAIEEILDMSRADHGQLRQRVREFAVKELSISKMVAQYSLLLEAGKPSFQGTSAIKS